MTESKTKTQSSVVLVSPGGLEYHTDSPTEITNLKARGYTEKSSRSEKK